jgi:glycosyltransferase involved in cell wall biosynthesis
VRFLLLNQYYPPGVAPTGRYAADLACALAARGDEVDVVCSRHAYSGGAHPARTELRDGARVHRVAASGFGRGSVARRALDYASFLLLALARGLRVPRPDVVVSLTSPPYLGVIGKAIARLRGAAHAHWLMDLYPDAAVAHGLLAPGGRAERVLAGLTRWQWRGARALVALGPVGAQRAARYAANVRVEPLPLWAQPELLAGEAAPPGAERPPRDRVLMYSGNMGLGHRFDEFLEAAGRLGADGPRWVFAGAGARRAEVERFRAAHPEARLELRDYVPEGELRASLASADAHLVSLRAAWQGVIVPSKLQSIFAVGRPVIFVGPRDNECARWIEEAGAGWVVGEGDVDALLAAVHEALDGTRAAATGAAARRFARERFDAAKSLPRLIAWLSAASS